ncbi:MAG: RHS repeat-associated core domain-containing protein [Candidatus Hadarchaeales archaeon]
MAGLTKHQGQSTHNYRYDAYGQVLPARGNWTDPHNHYTFLGKEWDEHLGLYEFGVRLYAPWAGVWLTREPLPGRAWEPRTWHRYQYAFASPISYYDPYGLAVTPWDGGGGPRPLWALQRDRAWWGAFYQSQGRLPNGAVSNDCGPTNLAMVLSAFLAESGHEHMIPKEKVTSSPFMQWWYGLRRLPPFLGSIGGATPPWGMEGAFNNIAYLQYNLGWHARWVSRGTKEDLLKNLQEGKPVTVMLVYPEGGAHYVTIVGYNPLEEQVYVLDPSPAYADLKNPVERVQEISWDELRTYWEGQNWWARLLGFKGEMIVYDRVPVPVPVPTPPPPNPHPTEMP